VAATLFLDWGSVCFFGCSPSTPIEASAGRWMLLAAAAVAAGLFVPVPRPLARSIVAAATAFLLLMAGIFWAYMGTPRLPAFLAILGVLACCCGLLAPLGKRRGREAPA
jgi:hypothetical protein